MTNKLIKGGKLVLFGPVGGSFWDETGFTDADVVEALAEMSGDIVVSLNSPGGNAFMGIAIYNALKAHDGAVTIEVNALAASAASVIAMAGDKVTMRTGSMMMIHDPSGLTFGTSKDHRKSAEFLDGLGSSAADIYAEKTGMATADILDLMREETWMTAAEAVERKFADAAEPGAPAEMTFPTFDYSLFVRTPDHVAASASNRAKAVSLGNRPASPAPLEKEVAMNANSPAPAAPAPETATIKDTAMDVFARCRSAKLTMDETDKVMRDAGGDANKARDLIIDMMAARDNAPEITNAAPARVIMDGVDKFREGVTRSLLSKAGHAGGEVNEFSSMSLREIARASLDLRGNKTAYRDPLAMVGAAMEPVMSGGHATSDFVHVLANVANKSMLKGWDEAEETFQKWTATGTLPDFKPGKRIDLNLFPALAEVPEGGGYTYASVGDRGETIQLATYGKMFSITRQAIINDDMSVFTRVPGRMGRAARRTIGNLVYAVLTGNPNMSDGVALFHANHKNLLTGAPLSVASLSAARTAMAKQKDPDEHAKGGLNIRPAYLLVPIELRDTAAVLMTSEFAPGETQRVPNTARGTAEVIDDARLSEASATAWYLAASPTMHDTIEVAYLNGIQTPTLEQRNGWNVDGTEFKVRIDAGVKALGFRAMSKNPGA